MAAAAEGQAQQESYKRIKTILVSQPKPERSPYYELEEKYGLQIDWRPFIHVEGLTAKEFRKERIRPDEYTAIVLTSKNAVDHFFRLCEEMRIQVSGDMKYFCLTAAIANYLQKFIVYRKRKVFVGKKTINDLAPYLNKHKAKEKFLLPCSNLGSKAVSGYLDANKFNWKDALMYRTVSSDLSDLSDVKYDVLVFFSPLGIKSLYENFPDFTQDETRMAIYGTTTSKAVIERGLAINIKAPAPEVPSMTVALDNYLKVSNRD
ncbi:MAG: uroporphyrinogen-III synthase [Bacteroidota bacterium]